MDVCKLSVSYRTWPPIGLLLRVKSLKLTNVQQGIWNQICFGGIEVVLEVTFIY